eukprot:CAMPEP_0179191014 /NCGR_PEP_ID=MMETSP0796-20121207/94866_1 /TAXON_ID=73915 /ORGANISM="Pyrodinium bahamense, Strain pbaha01" /LENGTH=34 /DNA_ID= /DNA_START= /DNA_END= /DNA_ORIENTATION=
MPLTLEGPESTAPNGPNLHTASGKKEDIPERMEN